MTEVLIDVTRILSRSLDGRLPTGVDRVSVEYVRHFRHIAQALVRYRGRWLILNPRDSLRLFEALLDQRSEFRSVTRWCVAKAYALQWKRAKAPRVFFNTDHAGLDRPDYEARIRSHGLQPLFFLHDLIPITHPEYCGPGRDADHRQRIATMLAVGRGLIFNSEATRQTLTAYAGSGRHSIPPSIVAALAPGRLPQPSLQRPLDAPYFVVLGTIESRKNHLLLLNIWRKLVEDYGSAAPRLAVIGRRGWECEQVVDLLDRCPALCGFVEQMPCCGDGELATWLGHSQALLFPSFAEGYGIPIIEALMLGVPVVASNLPAFREVGMGIPEYLDPLDGLGWIRAILDYAQPASPRAAAQRQRMQAFQPPSWERHFKLVDSLMEQVIDAA